jgi:hypothetical protein
MRFLPVHFQLAFHEGVMTDGPSLPNLISSEFLSWKTNQQNKIRISQEVNTSLDIYIIYVSGEHVRVWEPDGSASGGFPNIYSLRLDWFPLTGQSKQEVEWFPHLVQTELVPPSYGEPQLNQVPSSSGRFFKRNAA